MGRVLLLNASYEPLHVCSWRRAIRLIHKGKAVSIEEDSSTKLGHGYHLPVVIRLLQYIKIPHKTVSLTRRNLLHRDNYECQYCGSRKDLTIDHILPRSRGGKDEWLNVTTACTKCNVKKGNRTPDEAKMPLKTKPYRPAHFFPFELSKHLNIHQPTSAIWQTYLFVQPMGKTA